MNEVKVFKDFIGQNDILIVDKNPVSRNRLLKIMVDLGCKHQMVHTASCLEEAIELVNTKNIGVVLSDYLIGGGSGFDLFKMIREKMPDNKKLSLILVTSNISQSAVAKAAEEDVDSFIIKPFTLESIQKNLVTTIANKIQPSQYIIMIESGKDLISQGKYTAAIELLYEAIPLHREPALALFYIGQAETLNTQINEAQGKYSKGLSFNNIHYKCLVGLYDTFLKQNKFNEAYGVVKKVAKYFPANPDRLTQIVRLAIQTQNFDDMQSYYEIFTSLEERSRLTINYIGAGMYVSGKNALMKRDFETAFKYFDNVAVSCSEFSKFIRAIITALYESKRLEEAEEYLGKFTAENRSGEDFFVSEFLVESMKFTEPSLIVKKGLDLYKKGFKDFTSMTIMVDSMKVCDYKAEKILEFKNEILDLWPNRTVLLSA